MIRKALVALLAALIGLGCSRSVEPAPPEIRFGEEECDQCRMIISEERFAAAAAGPGGETAIFDDAGCLLRHLEESGGAGWVAWVRDHRGAGWVRAERAHFVKADERATPMASGLVGFANLEQAEEYRRRRGGGLLTWEELRP